MKFEAPVAVTEIANMIGAELVGNSQLMATGINEIHKVTPGDISFVDFEKYYSASLNSAATIIIINKKVDCPQGKALLVVNDPFSAYVKLVKFYRPFEPASKAISDTALIGEGTVIQPNVFIGNHVRIGRNCIIHPNVTIYDHTVIGDNVIIQAGTVIGADAFYFKKRADREVMYDKLESCGRVILENDVEIGAGCTIDKGVSGDTIIGQGTKLDNMIHIGHGTIIGKNCLFAAQVGIGGKALIEDNVILWGQVGVSKDLVIGKNAIVLAQSGVPSSIEGGKVYFGSPVEEARTKKKELAWIKRIPEIWEKVKHLS
ncbi:UDP-3-O-(3-hydroxymyristoyl)glucosamine N-acyltransferase [Chitinophaga sp. sic0106]|uniref:UDP-3-O-(3-hydroxymyristoyl)glucosamine N-acyltransferase n=1 Tax=Chitinophaga sp. sic0106 TaxID=2854785 RepID=UPI001C450674|nr:UDP-3-O-(3-hydroxymyristoyl)glucosamine N-acyltransferase [Chitinophaga sp. sic0106]MBV7528640.1 UDP-3-O-(3-hydroxymyristoyl)glucosamine N-acyltransferase [Chitinophaga sp. sic0106]